MAQAQNSQALAYYIQWRGQKNRLNLKSEKLFKKILAMLLQKTHTISTCLFPLRQKGNKALHPKVIIDGYLGSVSKLTLQLPHS